jgi:flavin-dependent dehydrogenase
MKAYDVVVVGGGPAGATAAAASAQAGLATLVIERAEFPRDKVCGDCLNPGVWPILDRIGASRSIESLPAARLGWVEFNNIENRSIRFELPEAGRGELGIRRKHFDEALIKTAISSGATVQFGEPVTQVKRESDWIVSTLRGTYRSRFLIAADGRNSTVARLLGHFPRTVSDRIGLQTHFPNKEKPHIVLEFSRYGYLGLATIGEGLTNLCLVCRPQHGDSFRKEAANRFHLSSDHGWRTITPLTRFPIDRHSPDLFYVGDSARVVEPFTGEGILYALKTGFAAIEAIVRSANGEVRSANGEKGEWRRGRWAKGEARSASQDATQRHYREAQRRIYQNRIWINQLARLSVLYPRISSGLLDVLRFYPAPLKYLTSKVVRGANGAKCE